MSNARVPALLLRVHQRGVTKDVLGATEPQRLAAAGWVGNCTVQLGYHAEAICPRYRVVVIVVPWNCSAANSLASALPASATVIGSRDVSSAPRTV
jgi:hypothetical protein